MYVDKNSNHPPSILKNIPVAVNRRLSNISANEQIFEEYSPPFQNALSKSGYSYKMKFEPKQSNNNKRNRNRKRDIIWFNPPWSLNCKTRVAANFLEIVKTSFPQNHPLRKIFNRNTIKVSYSLENKKNLSFSQFDLVEFYPSITEKILKNALNFAANYIEISDSDRKLILRCRKSYLCSNNSV